MLAKPIQSSFSTGEISPRLRAQTNNETVAASVKSMINIVPENHGIAMGRNGMTLNTYVGKEIGLTFESQPERIFSMEISTGDNYLVVMSPEEPIAVDFDIGHRLNIQIYEASTRAYDDPVNIESYDGVTKTTQASIVSPYMLTEAQDIHYVQVKDQLIFVHANYPPMKLVRIISGGEYRFIFTYVGTWGAEWGHGFSLDQILKTNEAGVTVEVGFPRTVAYYQQRLVYGGLTNEPSRLVFSRSDDISTIDTGYIYTKELPEIAYKAPFALTANKITVFELIGSHVDTTAIVVKVDGVSQIHGTEVNFYDPEDYDSWSTQMQNDDNIIQRSEYIERVSDGLTVSTITSMDTPRPKSVYVEIPAGVDRSDIDVEIVAPRPEDSAVVFDFASTTQDFIQWITVGEGLFIGTTGGEWVASADVYISALNPPTITQVSAYGSQHIQPLRVGDAAVYVTASGRELRAFRADYTANREKWTSAELTWQAEHLFRDYKIKEIAHTQTPDNIISIIDTNGDMFGAVYDPMIRDNSAFFRYESNTKYNSITSVTGINYDSLVTVGVRNYYDPLNGLSLPVSLIETESQAATMDSRVTFESSTAVDSIDLSGSLYEQVLYKNQFKGENLIDEDDFDESNWALDGTIASGSFAAIGAVGSTGWEDQGYFAGNTLYIVRAAGGSNVQARRDIDISAVSGDEFRTRLELRALVANTGNSGGHVDVMNIKVLEELEGSFVEILSTNYSNLTPDQTQYAPIAISRGATKLSIRIEVAGSSSNEVSCFIDHINLITESETDEELDVCVMVDGFIDYYGSQAGLNLIDGVYSLRSAGRFVEVGVPFVQSLALTDFDYGQEGSVYMEQKRHVKIFLDLIDSQPPMVNGVSMAGRSSGTPMGNLEPPIDGKTKTYGVGHDRNLNIEITQKYPYKLQLAAIFGATNIGDGG